MDHKLNAFSDGELCSVCFATTECLTTDCCGRILLPQERIEIARGNFDYTDTRGWFELLLDSEESGS